MDLRPAADHLSGGGVVMVAAGVIPRSRCRSRGSEVIQQGQVFKLKAKSADGEPLWAYEYRVAGRGSARLQLGGFSSRAEAQRALQNNLARLVGDVAAWWVGEGVVAGVADGGDDGEVFEGGEGAAQADAAVVVPVEFVGGAVGFVSVGEAGDEFGAGAGAAVAEGGDQGGGHVEVEAAFAGVEADLDDAVAVAGEFDVLVVVPDSSR
jgi:hypothetical protein